MIPAAALANLDREHAEESVLRGHCGDFVGRVDAAGVIAELALIDVGELHELSAGADRARALGFDAVVLGGTD